MSDYACPPYGFFTIFGSEVNNREVAFWGRWHRETGQYRDFGVPWKAAFNSSTAVEPGQYGRCTVDFPTWCLLDDQVVFDGDPIISNSGLMQFRTFYSGDYPWSLSQIPDINPVFLPEPDPSYWTGYRVFALQRIPEFDLWHDDPPFARPGAAFVIGFIGGLVTYLRGGDREPEPPDL